ncbi:hypothetical protein [Spirosoma jeollabukense]
MATTVERQKDIAKEMLNKKRRIQEYVKSGDETKKPAGIKFVKPFTLPTEGR